MNGGPDMSDVLSAVVSLRDDVAGSAYPLALPDAEGAVRKRDQLVHQLDDYVIPRLTSLDAPLLAVVGGSTGAGKSTLVNSLVGTVVSHAGVLRPTTRSPVLVHHPDDARWFTGDRVFPGLARATGPAPSDPKSEDPSAIRLVSSDMLPPGLAIVDAPDIDSVVAANRELAGQLLSAADLWVFVTTAARYADAVPWQLLSEAGERGTAVAIVLDRVPSAALEEIRVHLSSMLRRHGLGNAPIFTILESRLDRDGLLPDTQVGRLHGWLRELAADSAARQAVVRQTLAGALDSLHSRVRTLSAASRSQVEAVETLTAEAHSAYADALGSVRRGTSDGSLLRGEVLARWQEYVGTGEFFRSVETTVSKVRDRVSSFVTGEPPPTRSLGEALQSGLADLVIANGNSAAATTARAWRSSPGGQPLLDPRPDLSRAGSEFTDRVNTLVREWQGDILDLVRGEGKSRRTTAKMMAYGVNGVGVILILVTFAHTGGITGAEAGIAGGTAVLGQKLLEAIFGDQAVRELAAKARALLIERVQAAYALEQHRFDAVVSELAIVADQSTRLDQAIARLRETS